ncbi:BA75_01572T0 [Komagataella pastoris]|uniref:BA75_01572T0 n=1 Tax=Komagataella pastoris TaxID=4922 RepID=A0A1B2J800_PICPA|nr:BA75_01572T0 [Komagataella pastoris]
MNHSKLTRKVNQKICSRLCESFSKGSFWKQVNLDIVPYYLESDHTLVLQCYCRSFNEKLTEKFKTQLQHSAILKDCIDELQEVNFSLELISTRPILYDELVEHLNFLMTSNIFQLETMIPIVFSFYGIDSFLETIKYWENLCDSLSTTTTRSLMSLNMIKLLNNNMIESENFKAHFFKENKQFYNFASFFI